MERAHHIEHARRVEKVEQIRAQEHQ
jgi:hypothetical protein